MGTGDAMGLSFGVLAVCVAVAGAVVFVAMPRIGTPGPMTLFLRFAAVAGVVAVGSSAMYFIYTAGGGILALVLGDVAMVLAPGLLLVGLSTLEGRRARRTTLTALVLAVAVAVVTATVPLPSSLAVKATVLAAACGACAWAAARSSVEPFGPLRAIAIANAVYAVYSLARVVVGLITGWQSPPYVTAFSFAPATVVGAVAMLVIGCAVARLRWGRPDEAPPAVCPPGGSVIVGDWELASAAYGPERVRGLLTDLRAAARDLDPAAIDVPRGAETSLPEAVDALGAHLRAAYGWEPEQTILLVDGAATAAIRTQPGRTTRERKKGSARS